MLKYILDRDLIHREYVVDYTNAAFLIADDFEFEDGLFSGYDPQTRKYDKATWKYRLAELPDGTAEGTLGEPLKDPTLEHPKCVYQLLKKHYARYDLETVSGVTGTPVDDLKRVYRTFAETAAPEKAGTIMYAMG